MTYPKPALAALIFFLLVALACRENPTGPQQYDWPRSDPADQGLSTQWLDRAYEQALTIEGLLSLLVVRNGFLVVEHYFGYLWWIDTFRGHEAFMARGAQGQMIYVLSDLEMVVVTTGNLPQATFLQSLDQLVRSYILPAAD